MADSDFYAKGFTIDRMLTLCRIAESGSITVAAKGDTNRQSQYSRQVKELEEAVGAKLLERSGKSVRLTETGRQLVLTTKSYFKAINDMRAVSSNTNVVRIGSAESILRWVIMPHMEELRGLSNGLCFECSTHSTGRALEAVKMGQIDFAIVRKDAVDGSLNFYPFGKLSYVLVVPRSLLPGKTAAGFQLLQKLPFALLAGDGILAKGILAMASKLPAALEIRVKAENFSLLLAAIEQSEVATVLPSASVASLSKQRFAVIELEEMQKLDRELVLVYSPKAAELRENIRQIGPRISTLFRRSLA